MGNIGGKKEHMFRHIVQHYDDLKTLRRINRERRKIFRKVRERRGTTLSVSSLIVTGPHRIGKSHFCRSLAEKTGLTHIEMDGLSQFESPLQSERIRGYVWDSLVELIEKRLANGMCVDSTVTQKLWSDVNPPPSNVDVSKLRAKLGPRVIIILSRASVEERLAALRKFRALGNCWTLRHLTDDQLPSFAENIVTRCEEFARISEVYGLTTVWVEPLSFEYSISSAVERISSVYGTQMNSRFEING